MSVEAKVVLFTGHMVFVMYSAVCMVEQCKCTLTMLDYMYNLSLLICNAGTSVVLWIHLKHIHVDS